MPATKSSSASRTSRKPASGPRGTLLAPLLVVTLLAALSAAAIAFFYARGQLLWYGDAAAHVNIARRVLDSRTPGWDQIGTVWLPLPHVLMLPFVRSAWLWQSGLAGSIPSGLSFVLAGLLLFLAARRAFSSTAAGAAAVLLLALNPNVLYLQAIPMTESVYLASLTGVLYFTVRFAEDQSWLAVLGAGLFALAGTLTRYEGWFIIPFAAGFFFLAARRRRLASALLFAAVASLGPLYWLWHNAFFYGNALDFYNGASSAKAIYQRALDRGMARYAGDHDWWKAQLYVRTAIRLCAGWPLIGLALAGGALSLFRKRALWPLFFLALVPLFYVLSLHSGSTPIFVPGLWPGSYYNSRYAIGAMPLVAFAAAGLVALAPGRWQCIAVAAAALVSVSPWLAYPRADSWICWKESQVNSEARRAWTREAADFMRANYHRGEGILTSFGDMSAVYQQAGIPLRETFTECNKPWAATVAGKLPLNERWAVASSGDKVSQAILRAARAGPRYDLVKTITVKGAPVIEIYRRRQ